LNDPLLKVEDPTPTDGPRNSIGIDRDHPNWVLRFGPFRRMPRPVASVTQARGKEHVYTIEDLKKFFADRPQEVAKFEKNMATLQARLQALLDEVAQSPAGDEMREAKFFWAPAVRKFHEAAVAALYYEKYTDTLTAMVTDNAIEYRTMFKKATAGGKVGVTYDPEHSGGVEASLTGSGLLRPQDALTLSATSANQMIIGSLNFRVPYAGNPSRQIGKEILIFAEAGRDEKFRLGSLSADPFDHEFQNGGAEHQYQRNVGTWKWTMKNAALWANHVLAANGTLPEQKDNGLTIRHRESWTTTFGGANGKRQEVEFTPWGEYSPEVGWEKAFWQAGVALRAKLWFGGKDPKNGQDGYPPPMYVGVDVDGGWGSDDRPAALLYRMGDIDRMFGLDPGEFSGPNYSHGEILYSLSAAHVLRGVFKGEDGKPDPKAMPPLLQSLFVQAMAEVGRVSGTDRTLTSYGVAIETAGAVGAGGAGLRLGYAWSPQSFRSKGRAFTALNWSF
ncbi:MAG TPA: hypothetical protein VFJ90_14165, partial [Candidatus Didemnitutus sp.]|nr:hypothetical protein [Candidatus Didemnitutus sp.]